MGKQPNGHLNGLGAVILCGGSSQRMGFHKAMLPFGEKTFLECVLDCLRPIVSPIVLVTNPGQGVDQSDIGFGESLCITDEDPTRGPIEGIRVGLKCLVERNVELAFVTSCDSPLLRREFVRFLFDRIQPADEAIVPLRESRSMTDRRRVYGVSAIYRTSIHPVITELIREDKLKVSDISDHVRTREVALDEIRSVDPDLGSLTSVNSAGQYLELLRRHGYACPADILEQLSQ